jgi:hypothetical protein
MWEWLVAPATEEEIRVIEEERRQSALEMDSREPRA